MAKPRTTSAELQLLYKIRTKHESIRRELGEKKGYRIECPHCGVSLLGGNNSQAALCPSCGAHLSLRRLTADRALRLLRVPQNTYAELLRDGQAALNRHEWQSAQELFTQACSADPENGEAWYGLLASITEYFSRMQKTLPEQVAAIAQRTLGERSAQLNAQWSKYRCACAEYFETQERLKHTREQAEREAKSEAKAARKKAAEARRQARREARNDPARKEAQRNVLSVILTAAGIGLFFVFAMLGSGFFFIFLLGGLSLFGGNRRRK